MFPFGIERFMFYSGRKLYGFLITKVSIPGALAKIASIIAGKNLDIVCCSFSATERGKMGTMIFFVDFTEINIKPETLAQEIEGLDFVKKVEIIKPKFEGFIADTASFPIMLGPHRAIIITEPGLRGLLVDIRNRIGTGAEAILYYIGYEVSQEWAKHYSELAEKIGVKDLAGKITVGCDIFKSAGYGSIEILKLEENPPYGQIRIYDCVECKLGRGTGKPFSHSIRGTAAGFAAEVFGQKMFAKEIKCIAKGDPYCEFEITPEKQSQ
jgi:hypothetical protein